MDVTSCRNTSRSREIWLATSSGASAQIPTLGWWDRLHLLIVIAEAALDMISDSTDSYFTAKLVYTISLCI